MSDWSYMPLSEPQGQAIPVLSSPDGRLSFVVSRQQVRIYSTETSELLSVLNNADVLDNRIESAVRRPRITGLSTNGLQLVVAFDCGVIRVWDYLEGVLLKTINTELPANASLTHALCHYTLRDTAIICTETSPTGGTSPSSSKRQVSLQLIPLRGKGFATRIKMPSLSATKVCGVHISPEGSILALVTPKSLLLFNKTETSFSHTRSLEPDSAPFTCFTFHPFEDVFATGDALGRIRLHYSASAVDSVETTASLGSHTLGPAQGGKRGKAGGAALGSVAPNAASITPGTGGAASTLHWHAHAVSSLQFTANGAYLVSGGREGVLVLWQLATRHQEFIPRLGGPIAALSVTDAEVCVVLDDASVLFVSLELLKVVRTLATVKTVGGGRAAFTESTKDDAKGAADGGSCGPRSEIPLATYRGAIATLGGHPSTIQLYDFASDTPVVELEVVPSNRVVGMDETEEHSAWVERVAFVPESGSQARKGEAAGKAVEKSEDVTPATLGLLATFDTWSAPGFSSAHNLKFWNGTTLATRVVAPHGISPLTALAFSPKQVLLTADAGPECAVKLWERVGGAWGCTAKVDYAGAPAHAAAWSRDGSLFAVVHEHRDRVVVALWATATRTLLHAFATPCGARAVDVAFVGDNGALLAVAGDAGAAVYELRTLTLRWAVPWDVVAAAETSGEVSGGKAPGSPRAYVLFGRTSTLSLDLETGEKHIRALPIGVQRAVYIPERDVIATLTPGGALCVLGDSIDDLAGNAGGAGAVGASRQIRNDSTSAAQLQLFEEVFEQRTLTTVTPTSRIGSFEDVLQVPAHALPPVAEIWQDLFGAFEV